MDMSAAALPPRLGHYSEKDRQHPRFNEYMAYRQGMIRLMVDCSAFSDWLYQVEGQEFRDNWAKHPEYPNFLAWMRATQAGARKAPIEQNGFPFNFQYWLKGGRW